MMHVRFRGDLPVVITLALSIAGCNGAVRPSASAGPAGDAASSPPAPTSPSSPAPSAAPQPTLPVRPSHDSSVWLDGGALREPRNATSVVTLRTGEVLVVGSDYLTTWQSACGASTDGSDSVEIGNPLTGAWKTATSLPNLRDAPAVVALVDGRALMTGGAAGESIGWSAYSSTYIFDPAKRRWSRSGLLNTARTFTAAAVLLDGRVLVAGGTFMDRMSSEPPRTVDTSELWDPRSGDWSRTGRLAAPRSDSSAVTLADGRVLLVGGMATLGGTAIPQVEIYDPASGRWSSGGTLATARSGFVLAALRDGGAIVAGGFAAGPDIGMAYLSRTERFDPSSNSWSAGDDLPHAVAGAAGVRLADGRVLLAGGSVGPPVEVGSSGEYLTGLTDKAVVFDPASGRWTPTTQMPSPRAGASAVLLPDGSVAVVGGSISEGEIWATPGCPEAHPNAVRYVPG